MPGSKSSYILKHFVVIKSLEVNRMVNLRFVGYNDWILVSWIRMLYYL